MQDQRAYLKVKIKSLAEEAKIIRKEERKPHGDMNEFGYSAEYTGLRLHRVGTVRKEARHSLLAYGFIRGRRYRQMEAPGSSAPDWESVRRMALKYSLPIEQFGWTIGDKETLLKRFDEWVGEE